MRSYDPDKPTPDDWLQLDEGERIDAVGAFHRRKKITLPNVRLHAVIHVVVENQLALGDDTVVSTLTRLQREGLSRHDAVHAIGSVLAGELYELMREGSDTAGEAYRRYLEKLQTLTATNWHAG